MAAALHIVRSGPVGTTRPVVIVHGGMDRSSSFGRIARQLHDLPVVRYDRRGYGRSAGVAVAGVDRHVDDLLEIIGDEPAVVFGHSMGGVIAVMAGIQRPDRVTGVLAFEAPMPWLSWWPRSGPEARCPDPADEAERFMRQTVGDRIWERLPARTRSDRRSEGSALQADIASLEAGRALFDPAAVAVPLVVGTGSESSWWHRRGAEELATASPGAELAVVEGADHGVHLHHPRATADLVRRLHHRTCEIDAAP